MLENFVSGIPLDIQWKFPEGRAAPKRLNLTVLNWNCNALRLFLHTLTMKRTNLSDLCFVQERVRERRNSKRARECALCGEETLNQQDMLMIDGHDKSLGWGRIFSWIKYPENFSFEARIFLKVASLRKTNYIVGEMLQLFAHFSSGVFRRIHSSELKFSGCSISNSAKYPQLRTKDLWEQILVRLFVCYRELSITTKMRPKIVNHLGRYSPKHNIFLSRLFTAHPTISLSVESFCGMCELWIVSVSFVDHPYRFSLSPHTHWALETGKKHLFLSRLHTNYSSFWLSLCRSLLSRPLV